MRCSRKHKQLITVILLILLVLLVGKLIQYFKTKEIIENEKIAISSIKTISALETDHNNNTNPHSYTDDLSVLYEPPEGVVMDLPFIDRELSEGIKKGYIFKLSIGQPDGATRTWSATAVPIHYGKSGKRSFFVDESGIIRGSDLQGMPGTKEMPIIPEQ